MHVLLIEMQCMHPQSHDCLTFSRVNFGSNQFVMNHLAFVGTSLLTIWLVLPRVLQTSATPIVDRDWDLEKLSKQLHDPSKERIDFDCDACILIVDTIQRLARENASEDEVATVATELCIKLQIERANFICRQGVQEFKVSIKALEPC